MTAPQQHEPIVIDTTPPDEAEETIELFRLDGVSYRIPRAPRVAYAMRMLEDIEAHGAGVANLRLLRNLIGAEAFTALSQYDRLTKEQLELVSKAAMSHVLGGVEDTAGN